MPEKMRKSEQTIEKGPSKHRKRLNPGEYREGKIQLSTGKGRITASAGKVGFGRVPKKVGSERVSEKVKSG